MDLRHLQIFMRVCQHRSVSAAADELGMSQPALSKLIRRLEGELGVPLFDRLPRGLEPTHYAGVLAEAARQLEANYRGALRQIDSIRDGLGGEVAIGAGATWREELLPVALSRLLARLPGARFRIETGPNGDALVGALVDGRVDMALAPIVPRPALDAEIVSETLLVDPLVVACRADHDWIGREDTTIAELATLRWAVARGITVLARFRDIFLSHGMEPPQPTLASEDINCLLDIVASSDLVAYVPQVRVLARRSRRLGIIRCRAAEKRRATGVHFRRRSFVSPLARELVKELKLVLAEKQADAGPGPPASA